MRRAEFFERLIEMGLHPTPIRLQTAIFNRTVAVPLKDGGGCFLYTEEHVAQFATYLKFPPRRGRPKARPLVTEAK